MADYIINFAGNICELFIILFFLKDNYKPRFNKSVFVLLCVLLTIFQFLNTSIFLSESQLVLLGAFLFTFLVTMLFSLKWWHGLLFSIFICLANGLSEFIVGMTLSVVLDMDISKLQNNTLMFAICTMTSKFLTYITILFTKIKKFKTDSQSPKQYAVLVFSLPVASFLVMMLFLSCCYQIKGTGFHLATLIVSIILVSSNIAIYYLIDKLNELIETKEKLLFAELHIKNQVLHYQELYKHQNELRMFRHDIKNRLVALIALMKEGKTDKAISTMEKNLNFLEEMNNNVVNTGNPVIDAILQSKLHAAKDKQATLHISTKLAEVIKIDELELGIVLGNALDNAIDAVDKITSKENRIIKLNLLSTEDRLSLSVTNPVSENIDTNKLTTSKTDRENHGYGIKSIQTIAQKYNGIVSFTCENNIFNISVNIANHQ